MSAAEVREHRAARRSLLVGTTQVPRHGQANLAQACDLRNLPGFWGSQSQPRTGAVGGVECLADVVVG
jgi:hypothetical protein